MPRRDHLRRLLEAYDPADAREAQHREPMLRPLARTAQRVSRSHYAPGHVPPTRAALEPPTLAPRTVLLSRIVFV